MTREVTHLARRIEDARYVDHVSLTFKGIAEPVMVVRVVPEGEDPAIRLRPYASGHTPPAVRARAAGAAHETLPALGCDRRDRRGAGGEPGTFAGTLRHPNVFLSGWIADYLGARNFIEPQFACGEAGFANGHGWCDETLNERMDEASALQVTDPGAANRACGEIEHQLVDAGVQAPITNPLRTHAVSDRGERPGPSAVGAHAEPYLGSVDRPSQVP